MRSVTARTRHASAAATDAAFQRSGAAQWGVTLDRFAVAVDTAVAKRFERGTPDTRAVDAFIDSLHAQDLALACACADGRGDAWDHFVLTFRPELYRAARAMTDDASGRELADSLYADLYGMPAADGRRRSLLAYYHGRSKLSTWLRSVLSQRHVDLVRSRRRLTSLDDLDHPQPEPVAPPRALEPDESRRMTVAAQAVSDAIQRLEPHDRLRLAYC